MIKIEHLQKYFNRGKRRGKNKPIYTPHIDTGDYVIIVNADKIKVTGKKLEQKIYYHHSDYVGGMKDATMLLHML